MIRLCALLSREQHQLCIFCTKSNCYQDVLFLDKSIGATTEMETQQTTELTTTEASGCNITYTTVPNKTSMFMANY
jgi:hypothetical protein